MRSVALIHGEIKGMGLTCRCDILAMKEQSRDGGPAVFSCCCVLDALPESPDGDYTASFTGHTVSMKKEGGLWLPSGKAVPIGGEGRRGRDHRGNEPEAAAGLWAILRKHSV
jgi:hypothetical protein